MANTAGQTAKNAEADKANAPGMCLQQTRIWAGIDAKYPDATTAWKHTNDRHPGDHNPPRGSAVYWTGGSKGFGHIATSLGKGKVRSTDAGGKGRVATVSIAWVNRNWNMPYAGWAWDINEVTIPHTASGGGGGTDEDEGLDDVGLDDKIVEWSPDDGTSKERTTVGKTLNQARGYSEDSYERVKRLEKAVVALDNKVDKILAKLG